jgi:hypothetical protein
VAPVFAKMYHNAVSPAEFGQHGRVHRVRVSGCTAPCLAQGCNVIHVDCQSGHGVFLSFSLFLTCFVNPLRPE